MRRPALELGALLAAVALATANKLGNGAVWDDVHLLSMIERLREQGDLGAVATHSMLELVYESRVHQPLDLYRPLALLSFALPGGGSLAAQHLLNSALHLGAVALVYLHARRLLPADAARWSLLPAAWFGLTPALVEAHVWISGRFDLAATVLGLAALLLWRDAFAGDRPRALRVSAAATLMGLGLLCKESLLFALPALLFLPGLGSPARRLAALAPLGLAAALYMALRVFVLGGTGSDLTARQLALAALHWPVLVLDGALNAVVPLNVYPRVLFEDYAALGVGGRAGFALLALLLGVLLLRHRGRAPMLAWSALWLACTLAPVALVSTRPWPGFHRFLYLPASLWLVGLGVTLAQWLRAHAGAKSRRWVAGASLAALGALGLRSHALAYDWSDDETLFATVVEHAPDRSHGYGLLGMTLIEQRRHARSVPLLRKAVELAPDHRGYASQLGTALLFSGEKPEALALARAGIARHPTPSEFHLLAAYALLEDDAAGSAQHVLECLREAPRHEECLQGLRFLWREHPEAARYRDELQRLLSRPRYAALRGLL